ncbi:MAG: tRNA preQ1(34) S-adenosylmethionine ribosyltransferase-isomerase QueA [Candidatus Magnetominusculus sp. LBB02]|nr:tRNA preQ1(34) S-adenosylmethionine ribosyltransferase-isomerase QueA [Candidatus Magnetominusculus sp. LBB02]
MRSSDFLFDLPEELIAQYPAAEREKSRLMAVCRATGSIERMAFEDIACYFNAGDLLILNNTKVMPVKLHGATETGKPIEILIAQKEQTGPCRILSKGKYTGRVFFSEDFYADVSEGKWAVFCHDGPLDGQLDKFGLMPLPPYIKRPPGAIDRERYQTVYAEKEGSIAAPTAGLHFTHATLEALRDKGVIIETITLNVGQGTFKPVQTEYVTDHKMDSEQFEIASSLLEKIKAAKQNGNKTVAVGTTTTRAVEAISSGRYSLISSVPSDNGDRLITAATDIFIYPGHEFLSVDALITNFHVPRSTPVLLASAFAGRELLMRAYEAAIAAKYRFFSYGDVMLIL